MDTHSKTTLRPLLQQLQSLVEEATEKKFNATDHQALEFVVSIGLHYYETNRYLQNDAARSTFHKLYHPLRSVLDLLKQDANIDGTLIALDAYSDKPESIDEAKARRENLLRDLQSIYEHVPPPPPGRTQGRPSFADLRGLVFRLAAYWEKATGGQFKNNWHKGEPITPATIFVHAAVEYIDPERLPSLPKMTEAFVHQRHPGKPKKQRRRSSRK